MNQTNVEPETVQEILKHAEIQATQDLHTLEELDETQDGPGQFV